MSLLKCEIQLDEKKILEDGIYKPETIYDAVDNMFLKNDLIKGKNGFYYEKGNELDFAHFWSAILSLKNQSWFMPYVTKWLWYNSENAEAEDIIAGLKRVYDNG
jgi:hypothetical protein